MLLAQITDKLWDNGVAVGCLTMACLLIWKLISIGADKFEKVSDKHASTIQALSNAHRVERVEWKAEAADERAARQIAAADRDKRITSVCDELIKAIHDNKE